MFNVHLSRFSIARQSEKAFVHFRVNNSPLVVRFSSKGVGLPHAPYPKALDYSLEIHWLRSSTCLTEKVAAVGGA